MCWKTTSRGAGNESADENSERTTNMQGVSLLVSATSAMDAPLAKQAWFWWRDTGAATWYARWNVFQIWIPVVERRHCGGELNHLVGDLPKRSKQIKCFSSQLNKHFATCCCVQWAALKAGPCLRRTTMSLRVFFFQNSFRKRQERENMLSNEKFSALCFVLFQLGKYQSVLIKL